MKKTRSQDTFILGAGVTGLAAGWASKLPVFEARSAPGGICASYYVRPGEAGARLDHRDAAEESYRFENGGGHWIFGCGRSVFGPLSRFGRLKRYRRRAAVFFPDKKCSVPYPLQQHVACLGRAVVKKVSGGQTVVAGRGSRTMQEWLRNTFGPTLCDIFFEGFHDLYTAGLYKEIAPQDQFKSPSGVFSRESKKPRSFPKGYNEIFYYPKDGLDRLLQGLARGCDVRYSKEVVRIDTARQKVYFSDGDRVTYRRLLSTLPLCRVMEMTGLDAGERPDPHTSVLVLNIGGTRGSHCPTAHWLYLPEESLGFYRVGCYHNIDVSFLPGSVRRGGTHASFYVERAFRPGQRLSEKETARYRDLVVRKLKTWGFIKRAEVVCDDWIPVAYTWSRPGSRWKEKALRVLEKRGIVQAGRYGRWHFQGIAESFQEGLKAGRGFVKP